MQFDSKHCDHGDQLFISKRQASIAAALCMVLCLAIFLFGYFWGKYTAVHEQSEQELQEILLKEDVAYGGNQADDQVFGVQEKEAHAKEGDGMQVVTSAPVILQEEQSLAVLSQSQTPVEQQITVEKAQEVTESGAKHQALLIGFGTKTAADAFAQRLHNKGIEVIISAKTGKTARGNKRTWYQAFTGQFDTQEELKAVVNLIQKLEHIKEKDITIQTV